METPTIAPPPNVLPVSWSVERGFPAPPLGPLGEAVPFGAPVPLDGPAEVFCPAGAALDGFELLLTIGVLMPVPMVEGPMPAPEGLMPPTVVIFWPKNPVEAEPGRTESAASHPFPLWDRGTCGAENGCCWYSPVGPDRRDSGQISCRNGESRAHTARPSGLALLLSAAGFA